MSESVSIDNFSGGIGASLKEGQRGSYAYGRNINIHEDSSLVKLLPGMAKDSGSTVTDLVIDIVRVPNGDTYFLGRDKKLYKRTSGGTWSTIGTISGDTNGMGMYYWPQKDTIYITTDTSITTYGRISNNPSLNQNKFTTFIDQQIDVAGNASYPDQGNIQGWWKMEEESTGQSITYPQSGSIQGHWLLDEASGDRSDETGNSNDLTDTNTVESSTDAKQGARSADFELDNSEKLVITDANQTGLDVTGDFSFTCWIKMESQPGSGGRTVFLSKWNNSDTAKRAYLFGYFNDAGTKNLELQVVDSGGTSRAARQNQTLTNGTWYHLGVVYDASAGEVDFYVDGSATGASPFTSMGTSIRDVDADFNIGGLMNAGLEHDGLMDDAVFWNTELTSSEMSDLYDEYASGVTRADSSGNSNDLTDNGFIVSSTDSQEGNRSADFEADDNQYLSITDASQTGLDLIGDLSIACWVKLESLPGTGNRMGLVTKWTTSGDARAYEFNYLGGVNNQLEFGLSTDGTSGNADTATVNQSLSTGTWYHLGVVYDASVPDVTFYVDGSIVGTAVSITGGSIANTGADFKIGSLDTGSYLDGKIDDVIIWNLELSASDVDDAKNAASGSYSVDTSISETAANRFSFTPSWDPHINVVIPVASKGTGDWTVTLHDDADNTVASKTITNGNLTGSADNTFTFSSQVRLILGATYHYHITSTVNDGTVTPGNDAIDTTADRLVDVKSDAHPIVEFLDFIAIADGRYLRKYDGNIEAATDSDGSQTSSWETAFTLPSGYEIVSIARYDEYIVAGADYRGDNVDDFAKGLLIFWDGTSEDINSFLEIEEGGVHTLLATKNLLYFIAGLRGELFAFGSDEYVKIKRFPETSYGTYARSYHSQSTVYQGMPLFGAFYETDSSVIPQGVYAYGAREAAYREAFTHDYTASTGTVTDSSLQIGAVKSFGTDLFMGWDDNGTYGVDIVEAGSSPASTGVYEALVFDDQPNLWRDKVLHGVKVYHESLPAGAEVLISYKVNRGSWVDGTANTTDGTTETIFNTGKILYKELQVKVTLTATTNNFEVYNIVMDTDLRRDNQRIIRHA